MHHANWKIFCNVNPQKSQKLTFITQSVCHELLNYFLFNLAGWCINVFCIQLLTIQEFFHMIIFSPPQLDPSVCYGAVTVVWVGSLIGKWVGREEGYVYQQFKLTEMNYKDTYLNSIVFKTTYSDNRSSYLALSDLCHIVYVRIV